MAQAAASESEQLRKGIEESERALQDCSTMLQESIQDAEAKTATIAQLEAADSAAKQALEKKAEELLAREKAIVAV